MSNTPTIVPVGDTALSVTFADGIDRQANSLVLALNLAIQHAKIDGMVTTVPSFSSLLVIHDPTVTSQAAIASALQPLLTTLEPRFAAMRKWSLPVCYTSELGEDLEGVARSCGCDVDQVIALHTSQEYFVYTLGFLPGYAYMGDVIEPIRLPRRVVPRLRVPPGSVAIAGQMTAVYPWESPGGWHLIGRTPIPFFDTTHEQPALLAPGDSVTFSPISIERYRDLQEKVSQGRFDRRAIMVA